MTTKELINQYVTAHAANRWMGASELEALLTEFAEKLMKDAVDGEVNIWGSHISLPKVLPSEFSKQRVKVIIIKE